MQKLVPLGVERGPIDLHQAGVVGAAIEGKLAEPIGVDPVLFVLDVNAGNGAHTLDSRMVLDVHGATLAKLRSA